mmetsp:Transcript_78601/g.230631  ORF Transcript_78601/g.230631 Transcript_78601/m.230631 type:complete len:269 (-) Transcript_78601:1571-2377(-)
MQHQRVSDETFQNGAAMSIRPLAEIVKLDLVPPLRCASAVLLDQPGCTLAVHVMQEARTVRISSCCAEVVHWPVMGSRGDQARSVTLAHPHGRLPDEVRREVTITRPQSVGRVLPQKGLRLGRRGDDPVPPKVHAPLLLLGSALGFHHQQWVPLEERAILEEVGRRSPGLEHGLVVDHLQLPNLRRHSAEEITNTSPAEERLIRIQVAKEPVQTMFMSHLQTALHVEQLPGNELAAQGSSPNLRVQIGRAPPGCCLETCRTTSVKHAY